MNANEIAGELEGIAYKFSDVKLFRLAQEVRAMSERINELQGQLDTIAAFCSRSERALLNTLADNLNAVCEGRR